MVTRIVKLHFQENKVTPFLTFFDSVCEVINNFPGCYGMKLYQDVSNPCIVLTYSHWKDQKALNYYRESKEFGDIWPNIKPWFQEKPEAWTVNTYFDGFNATNS